MRRERGAVLVEMALVLPVLLLLLLGIITVGGAYNEKQQLTHAAREGARYGATLSQSQTFSSGTWASNVRDLVVERGAGSVVAADVCVSLVSGSPGAVVTPAGTFSTSGSPCISGQTYPVTSSDAGLRVQITVEEDYRLEFGLFGMMDVTLESSATAMSEASS